MPLSEIAGYRILDELGHGAAGYVYRARRPDSDEEVAVKIMSEEMGANEMTQRRFVQEMQVMERLNHPGIVRLFDRGIHDGRFFFVMELVDYGTLKLILAIRESLSWRDACEVAKRICDALEHAHSHGIVHRDLKPSNIFLSTEGHVKLGDFGVARDIGSGRRIGEGLAVGTAPYMAPEQIRGEANIDGRLDLYALGCVIFEMVSGRPPFTGNMPEEVKRKHLIKPAPDLKAVTPQCPSLLAALVHRLLAKNPADRPATALEVKDALDEVLTKNPVRKREPAVPDKPANLLDDIVAPDGARREMSWGGIAVAVGFVILLIVVIALVRP